MRKKAILPKIDIIKELTVLSKAGFVKSLRKGNTGVGYTLETILGIKENNEGEPDFIFKETPIELKSQREHSSSNVTLFTFEPPRGTKKDFVDLKLLRRFGYIAKGRKNLYITMRFGEFNQQGFGLDITNGHLLIIHKEVGLIWDYPLDYLIGKIRKKLSHKLLVVTAKSKEESGKEYFHYLKANFYSHVTENGFIELIKNKDIVVEFRMHIGVRSNGNEWARNHGTPFRINLRNIDKLFSKKEKVL